MRDSIGISPFHVDENSNPWQKRRTWQERSGRLQTRISVNLNGRENILMLETGLNVCCHCPLRGTYLTSADLSFSSWARERTTVCGEYGGLPGDEDRVHWFQPFVCKVSGIWKSQA